MSLSFFQKSRYSKREREICFECWIKAGSLKPAAKMAFELGVMDKNGKPLPESTLNRLARMAILSDPEKYRSDIEKDYLESLGSPMTQAVFDQLLVSWAMVCYRNSPKKFNSIMISLGLSYLSTMWEAENGTIRVKSYLDPKISSKPSGK